MLIQLMSDLHFEFHRDSGTELLASMPPTGADVLVLAGDILLVHQGQEYAQQIFQVFCNRYRHVIYVPGNHEYYRMNASVADEIILAWPKTLKLPNLHVLQAGRSVEIDGRRFLGDTLWFRDHPENVHYADDMNDFRLIGGFGPWVYERNRKTVAFLEKELQAGDVVVTHHLPSFKSVPRQYAKSPLNRFFVCDLENLIRDRQPAAWFHGHTHTPAGYKLGSTAVLTNPMGYPHEGAGLFRDDLVFAL